MKLNNIENHEEMQENIKFSAIKKVDKKVNFVSFRQKRKLPMIFIIKIDATRKTGSSSKHNNIKPNNCKNKKCISYTVYIRKLKKENDKGLRGK